MSASKKKRKNLDEQGLSPKAIEARKKKEQQNRTIRTALSVVLTIAVLAAIVTLVVSYANKELNTPNYDVSAAVATIGDEKISVPVYNFFFHEVASQHASQFASGTPLSQQQDGEKTMEDTMKENTKTFLQEVYNLYIAAEADSSFSLSDEEKKSIDNTVSSMKTTAVNSGFSNLNSYLRTNFGAGCDEDSYRKFLTIRTIASSYSEKLNSDFAPSQEELEKEYKEDPSAYDLVRFTYATSAAESTVVPASDTEKSTEDATDATGTASLTAASDATSVPTETIYTDSAKAAARETAEGYLKDMPDSAVTVSYNKSILEMLMSSEAAQWLYDEGRKQGDTKVFAAGEDETFFYAIRFEERDTNDYKPVNANIISITRSNSESEEEPAEGEKTPEEKFEALKAAVKEGMTDEEFVTAVTELGFTNVQPSSVTKTYSNDQIRDYLFDAKRKAGDLTTIETDGSYYVVRYASAAEENYRDTLLKNSMLNKKFDEITSAKTVEIVEDMMKYAHTDLTF